MSISCNGQSTDVRISPQTSVYVADMTTDTTTSNAPTSTPTNHDNLINRRTPTTYSEMMSSRRHMNGNESKDQSSNDSVSQTACYGNVEHHSPYDINAIYSTGDNACKSTGNYEYYEFNDPASNDVEFSHVETFDNQCGYDCHSRHPFSYQYYGENSDVGHLNSITGSKRQNSRCAGNGRSVQGHIMGLNSTRGHHQKVKKLSGYSNGNGRSAALTNSLSLSNEQDIFGINSVPIELLVTNLDFNIGSKEWKKILFMQFNSVVKSLQQVYMQTQQDGSSAAVVRVQTIEEARLLISHFHRKKIGYKRIQVNLLSSYNHCGGISPQSKQEVITLLRSVTGGSLSVCKFMELFEKRYHRSISISDLYKMKDIVEIKEFSGNQSGRLIVLIGGSYPVMSECETSEINGLLESPVCSSHCVEGTQDYIEALDACLLPNVMMPLKSFKHQVHRLLQIHNGSMPLMSFPACYKAEFSALNLIRDLGFGGAGVPLEHLITCVTGVRVVVSSSGVKKIKWEERKDDLTSQWTPNGGRAAASAASVGLNGNSLGDQMHQFSREVVDLIKHQPGCKILLSKFIPAYHHHFGKQCRVADYGFSKLHELVEALPHVVHVLGSGNLRVLTLSHKVQVRRFTNELTKVLKSTQTKSCRTVDIPGLYLRIIGRPFEMADYGVCFLEDMLDELPDNTVETTTGHQNEMMLSLPRRIQTVEEKEKTSQFSLEVVDLLKQSPRCRLPFTKFIPSYHHHFSRQCRVSDYGFSKLVELLEAVPHVVKIVEEFGEKYVSLTRREHLRVLAEQTLSILEGATKKRIFVRDFINVYMKHQGHALNLEDFGVRSVRHLLQKMPRIVKLEFTNGEEYAALADRADIRLLAHKVLLVLLDLPCGSLSEAHFCEKYRCMYREEPDLSLIRGELSEIVQLAEDPAQPGSYRVKLRPLILFARDLRDLLRLNQGKVPMGCFESVYEKQYGESLRPQAYGYPSTATLLQAVDFVAVVRGRGVRSTILLCQEFLGKLSYKVAFSTDPVMDATDMEEERIIQNQQLGIVEPPPQQMQQQQPTCFYPPTSLYDTTLAPTMPYQHLNMGLPPAAPGNYLLQPPQLMPPQPPPTHRPMIPGPDLSLQQPASLYFNTGQHDQRQLDELIERLAYESSPSPAPLLPSVSSNPAVNGGYEYASPPHYVPAPQYHTYYAGHPQISNGYWYESPQVCPMLSYAPVQPPQSQPPVMQVPQQQPRPMQPFVPVVTSPVVPASVGDTIPSSACLPKDINDSMCSLEDSTPVKQMMVAMGMKTEVDGNNNIMINVTSPASSTNESPACSEAAEKVSTPASNNSGAVYKLNAVNLPPAIYTQGSKTEMATLTSPTAQIGTMMADLKLESDGDHNHSPTQSGQSHDRATFPSLRTN